MLVQSQPSNIPLFHDVGPDAKITTQTTAPPTIDQNPLLDVKIPEAIIGPESDQFNIPCSPTLDFSPSPEIKKPEAVIGPDAGLLVPPSLPLSKPKDRNPLRDISLPNAIVSPDFQKVRPPSPSPTIHSARNFSSLACPPQLLPQEWSQFTTDLESAAARSNLSRTSFAIAIGISSSVGYTVDNGSFVWGKFHHLAAQDGKATSPVAANFNSEWQRGNVAAVVENWNEKWADRGVRVALEVNGKQ